MPLTASSTSSIVSSSSYTFTITPPVYSPEIDTSIYEQPATESDILESGTSRCVVITKDLKPCVTITVDIPPCSSISYNDKDEFAPYDDVDIDPEDLFDIDDINDNDFYRIQCIYADNWSFFMSGTKNGESYQNIWELFKGTGTLGRWISTWDMCVDCGIMEERGITNISQWNGFQVNAIFNYDGGRFGFVLQELPGTSPTGNYTAWFVVDIIEKVKHWGYYPGGATAWSNSWTSKGDIVISTDGSTNCHAWTISTGASLTVPIGASAVYDGIWLRFRSYFSADETIISLSRVNEVTDGYLYCWTGTEQNKTRNKVPKYPQIKLDRKFDPGFDFLTDNAVSIDEFGYAWALGTTFDDGYDREFALFKIPVKWDYDIYNQANPAELSYDGASHGDECCKCDLVELTGSMSPKKTFALPNQSYAFSNAGHIYYLLNKDTNGYDPIVYELT